MPLRMWTYDLAREQAPTLDHLRRLCDLSLQSGYNALGLYLEHRFAYPSAPWAQGAGCLTPEMVRTLQEEFKDLKLVPLVNLLGHFEGMLYTEHGKRYAESLFQGMQACPSSPAFFELAHQLLDDVIEVFTSDLIHLGGDETKQLGECPACQARIRYFQQGEGIDGKARIYGLHFGPLARRTLARGRLPALWGDMFLQHPQALDLVPKETIIFNWQYLTPPEWSMEQLGARNPQVLCPTLHTYNATWCHLPQAERIVRAHANAAAAAESNAVVLGVCVTTWEAGLFGNYETLLPAIKACGKLLGDDPPPQPRGAGGNPKLKWPGGMDEEEAKAPLIRLATVIVAMALNDYTHTVVFEDRGGNLWREVSSAVGFDDEGWLLDEAHAQILAEPLINRLRALSCITGVGRSTQQSGAIEGTFDGQPFRFDVRYDPPPNGPRLTLTRDPRTIGRIDLESRASALLGAFQAESKEYGEWARLMGVELQKCGGTFMFGRIRSSLRCRLLLYGNPFLAWLHHGKELSGEVGEKALQVAEHALSVAPNAAARGVSQFLKSAVEFVRMAEQARQAYAEGLPGVAVSCLTPARQIFDDLAKVAKASHLNFGGSLADAERCVAAKEHVERVIRRIKDYGDGSLGYLPAFEHITHPKFIPHDQGAWWLLNTWANE